VLVLQFLGFDPEVKKYIYVASLSLMFGFSSIFASLFQHHMKTLYYSLPEMFVALLTAVAMAILAAIGAPVLSLVVINGFSIVMTTVIYWTLCVNKLHLRPIFVFDPVLSKKILQSAWPILFAGLFVAINTRVDQLILYRLKGDAEVGAYSAAVKFTELLSFIPVAFTTVIFPFMCDSYNSSKEKFVFVYRRSFKYMAIIIIPVAIGTSILAEPIVNLVYGTKFHGSATILAVLIWSQIFVFMGCVNGNMLIIMNLQKILFSLTLVAAVTNILLNLWLIPTYSGLGAAIATVISYGCVGILIQGTLRQTRPIMLDYLGATIKPIIASVIMGLVIYNLSTIHLMMDIFIGMITYVTSIFLIKGVDSVDSGYVRQILYRQRGVRVIE
jgi:O-antigen/teichoic acid export membrane protein